MEAIWLMLFKAWLVTTSFFVQPTEVLSTSVELAVIVNPSNSTSNLRLSELREYMKLEKQVWRDSQGVEVILPPRGSEAKRVLVESVYQMTRPELDAYWKRKIRSGEIEEEPDVSTSATTAGTMVMRSEGAITVVRSSEVPRGVKVLSINGKLPGAEGYPLMTRLLRR